MKKFLALLLSCLLLLSLVACAATEEESNDNNTKETLADEMTYQNLKYAVNEDGYFSITGYIPNGVEPVKLTIPASIEGREVTGIADSAFRAGKYIASVEFEADAKTGTPNIQKIGQAAFYDCDALTSIVIPATVKSIGESAFRGCDNLASVTFAEGCAITEIAPYTFWDCAALTGITVPATVTVIDDGAFWNCESLTSFFVPDAVEWIGDAAFADCIELVDFSVSEALTDSNVGSEVLANCDKIQVTVRPVVVEG